MVFAVALVPAMADTDSWTFTFTDAYSYVDTGTLAGNSNGNGTYTIDSGGINMTDPGNGLYVGSATIYQNPNPPNAQYSPSGFFIYDDQLLPTQDPLITNPGLLFVGPGGSPEINLFSQGGPPEYLKYVNSGANVGGVFALTSHSVLTNVDVPEPGAVSLLFAMLAGIGGLAGVLKKKLS